jgi:hypothetical protein
LAYFRVLKTVPGCDISLPHAPGMFTRACGSIDGWGDLWRRFTINPRQAGASHFAHPHLQRHTARAALHACAARFFQRHSFFLPRTLDLRHHRTLHLGSNAISARADVLLARAIGIKTVPRAASCCALPPRAPRFHCIFSSAHRLCTLRRFCSASLPRRLYRLRARASAGWTAAYASLLRHFFAAAAFTRGVNVSGNMADRTYIIGGRRRRHEENGSSISGKRNHGGGGAAHRRMASAIKAQASARYQ